MNIMELFIFLGYGAILVNLRSVLLNNKIVVEAMQAIMNIQNERIKALEKITGIKR